MSNMFGMKYNSDGCLVLQLEEYGYDDVQLCHSEGEAYSTAYLLNGGPDIL